MKKHKNTLLFVLLIVLVYWIYVLNIPATEPTLSTPLTEETNTIVPKPVVQTPNPVAPIAKPPVTTPTLPLVKNGVYQVYYQNSGFYPKKIEIKAGTSVRFTNLSGRAMYITPSEPILDAAHHAFSMSKSIGKNATFDYTFNDSGFFMYKNYDATNDTGIVVVNLK